jgi:hypothetical protein
MGEKYSNQPDGAPTRWPRGPESVALKFAAATRSLQLLAFATACVCCAAGIAQAKSRISSPACPIASNGNAHSPPGSGVEVIFHIRGIVPLTGLEFAYDRLAECWPAALAPVGVTTERAGIIRAAQGLESWPSVNGPALLGTFDDAVDILTRYCSSTKSCSVRNAENVQTAPGERTFYLPTTQVAKTPIDMVERIKSPSMKALANVCAEHGLSKRCLSISDVRTIYADNKASLGHFVTVKDAYRLDLHVRFALTRTEAVAAANDILGAISNGYIFRKLGRLDPMQLPTFAIRNVASGKGQSISPHDAAITQKNSPDRVRLAFDWEKTWRRANGTQTLVVEAQVLDSEMGQPPFPSSDLKHPYINGGPTNTLKRLPADFSDTGLDRRHLFHVVGIIAASGTAEGWSGLSTNSRISIVDLRGYDSDILTAGTPPGGTNYFRAANFSLALAPNGCTPDVNNSNFFRRILGRIQSNSISISSAPGANPSRPEGTPLFVFAASERSSRDCQTADRDYPIQEDAPNCHELACLGQYPVAVTVLPLDIANQSPRPDAISGKTANNLMLAAPGTAILSADYDEATGTRGLRYRSGSSQAAPIVTAAAIELYTKYSYLAAADLKARLYATARMFPESSPGMTGSSCATGVVGVLDMKRALESDPQLDTVWLQSKPNQPLQGDVLFYGTSSGSSAGYTSMPLNEGPDQCSGGSTPIKRILAIKRVRANPGQDLPVKFRNLFAGGGAISSLSLSAPYRIDDAGVGAHQGVRCAASSDQRPNVKLACVQIKTKDGGSPSFVAVSDIDEIVFARGDRF